ncbi:MAG: hypothetical protein ACOX66_01115 [Oscillospiraceae bacterium]
MDDMTGAINSILNDPEQMQKVMEMAGQIMGNSGAQPDGSASGGSAPSLDGVLSSLGGSGGTDPQLAGLLAGAGAKLSKLLGGGGLGGLLGGGSGNMGGLGRLLGGNGSGLQGVLQNAARSAGSGGDKKQLIEALKPWLSESRQAKLDRAMSFARVMRIAGAVALLREGPK